MSQAYSDSRYGVEKILTFPSITPSSTGIKARIVLTEDIVISELGAFITTALTSGLGMITLQESAGVVGLATLTLTGAISTTLRQTTILNSTAANSGETIVINVSTAADSGVIVPYIKYKANFV